MPGNFKKIPSEVKSTILRQVKNDGRSLIDAAQEFGVSTKTISNWLKSEVDESGVSLSSYLSKIHRLEKEKEDLVQIIGALSIVVERVKKKDEQDRARTLGTHRK
jgi:transposase-like protein